MKINTRKLFLLPALVAVLNLISASRVTAQTLTTLHTFPPLIPVLTNAFGIFYTNSDGANPAAGLILSGNILYGTANGGGSAKFGTLFSLSFRPQLTIRPSGANIILSWPISFAGFSYAGYSLEDTANLGSSTGWNNVADTNAR